MDRISLPHGAKGIEDEGFAIAFGVDKVVLIAKPRAGGQPDEPGTETHYTFHAGPDSGVIDLHETSNADGRKHHRTLFALQADDLPRVLQGLAPMIFELVRLVRPLRLGWLAHRSMGIARGVDPFDEPDFAAVTRKRKKRLVVDAQLYGQNIFVRNIWTRSTTSRMDYSHCSMTSGKSGLGSRQPTLSEMSGSSG